ncbi:MAG: hypothetical protein CME64_14295 [Halobacteriovoraceae bacterium]|nr:hypothetical protein [Halobacteriovoraceae bacterium]|tara:strand:+ start:60791 stop:61453 length:663 start_codon:yes stop_codon:yes gene_type:complete
MSTLAIGAHPDDIEIGCGGTLGKLISQGEKVTVLIITDGRAGSLEQDSLELVKLRQNEGKKSAKVLGVHNLISFDLADGLVSFSRDEKLKMIELIRTIRPDTIFIHANDDKFNDHQIVRSLVLDSIQVAAGPWYSEVGGSAHLVRKVYGYEVWNPINRFQLAVDVSDFMKLKLEALKKHKSQITDINYLDGVKGLGMYRGAMSGVGKYAEVFEVMQHHEL